MRRTCKSLNEEGRPCRQAPGIDKEFCYWHDPENEREANEARRMGGLNRRREQTLATIYQVEGVDSIGDVQRFIEIALMGNLALDNSVQRNRAIVDAAMAALKVYEQTELARKVEQIESVLESRLPKKEEKRKRWGLFS